MKGIEVSILNLLRESNYPISSTIIVEILKSNKSSVNRALKKLVENKYVFKINYSKEKKYILTEKSSSYKFTPHVSDFKNIKTSDELIAYLSDINRRLSNNSMIYQYTNLSSAINIIKNGYWYLGTPKNMNDGLELQQGTDAWDNIFFSSFMTEQKESIAMWSMYAQPWENGVMISIPVREFKQWVKDIRIVYSADPKSKKIDRNNFVYLNNAKISVTKVAYSNQNNNKKYRLITCGSAQNSILKRLDDPKLIGYIKNDAWSYEKEVRLRVDLGTDFDFQGVAIDIPDYLINSLTITNGPRFKGDIMEQVKSEIKKSIKTNSSLFYGNLKYIPCDHRKHISKNK